MTSTTGDATADFTVPPELHCHLSSPLLLGAEASAYIRASRHESGAKGLRWQGCKNPGVTKASSMLGSLICSIGLAVGGGVRERRAKQGASEPFSVSRLVLCYRGPEEMVAGCPMALRLQRL